MLFVRVVIDFVVSLSITHGRSNPVGIHGACGSLSIIIARAGTQTKLVIDGINV